MRASDGRKLPQPALCIAFSLHRNARGERSVCAIMQPVGRRDNNKWKPSSFGIEPTAMQAGRSIHGARLPDSFASTREHWKLDDCSDAAHFVRVAIWRSVAPAQVPVLHRRPRLAALQRKTRRIAPLTCPDSPPVLRSEHRRATGLGEPASQNPAVDARAEDRESRYQQRFAVDNITEAAEDFERALQLDPGLTRAQVGLAGTGFTLLS